MDPLSAGFAFLQAGGAATVLGGVGYAFWRWRRAAAQRLAAPWHEAAGSLGFTVETGGSLTTRWVRLEGRYDGRAARAQFLIAPPGGRH